jgi:hypothetical protein
MKNIFKPLIAVLVIVLFVTGCKKDKEEESVKNYFNYNGTEYILSQGFLENYGKYADEGYNIDLTLLSSDFTIQESNGEIDSLTGAGDVLLFEIFTSLPDKLDVRDYIYDETESGAAGTFDWGVIGMDMNIMTETGTAYEITAGKVSVTSNGSTYEITINCTANGKTLTGYYKGSLKYYNYDKKKKSEVRFQKNKSVFGF